MATLLIKTLTKEKTERRDYADAISFLLSDNNGNDYELEFCDGEPEDNSLSRNFSDAYNIQGMIELAHKIGLRGEELKIEYEEIDEM